MGTHNMLILREYRERHKRLSDLVDTIKLWPSRTGLLHGVKSVKKDGDIIVISTHCGCTFKARDSKKGRGIRQLRNRRYRRPCKKCAVPDWKIEKFANK